MLAFDSMRVEDRHALVPSSPSVLVHKDINTFGAFLNEFTGGSCVPPPSEVSSNWRSTASTFTNGGDDCQSSSDSVVLCQGRMLCQGRSFLRYVMAAARAPSDTQVATVEVFERREKQNDVELMNEWPETKQGNELDGQMASSPSGHPVDANSRLVQPSILGCITTEETFHAPSLHTGSSDSTRQRHPRHYQRADSVSVPDEPRAGSVAVGHINLFRAKRRLAHASVRTITNTTYLRRMHMSKEDAVGLFPKVHETIEHIFSTDMKRRVSLGSITIPTTVVIQDDKGRRWHIVLECLRTAGQRHVRINKGWAAMCGANGLSVGKCVRFERWVEVSQAGNEEVVTVTML